VRCCSWLGAVLPRWPCASYGSARPPPWLPMMRCLLADEIVGLPLSAIAATLLSVEEQREIEQSKDALLIRKKQSQRKN
jgi:hypothetical protein